MYLVSSIIEGNEERFYVCRELSYTFATPIIQENAQIQEEC